MILGIAAGKVLGLQPLQTLQLKVPKNIHWQQLPRPYKYISKTKREINHL